MFLTKLSHTEQNYGWEPYSICCLGNHPSPEPALSHNWCGEEVCDDREQCEPFSSFPTSIRGLRVPYKVNRSLCVCAQLLSRVWLCLPSSSVHGVSHGKNTRVGCHSLLQGIFLMDLQRFLHWQAGSLPPSHLGSPNRNVLDLYPWRPKDPSFPNPLSKIHRPPLFSSQKLSRFFFK